MFITINRWKKKIQKTFKSQQSSNQGQVAVVLILVIAVALVFYAVSLNLGKVSEHKTRVTIAANIGASQLASQMASYGQKLIKEDPLNGKRERCYASSVWMAIITLIIIIIIIVLSIFTVGGAAAALGPVVAGLLIAVAIVLAVVNVILQSMVIIPGIVAMWNSIMSAALTPEDQFLESGIQQAIFQVVNDSVRVPDIHDLDTDRVFGFEGDVPRDTISRFAVYYNERLQVAKMPDTELIKNFVEALDELLHEGDDGWGLYDPPDCAFEPGHPCCYDPLNPKPIPSECNPCCVPDVVQDPFDSTLIFTNVRPDCCDTGDNFECGVSTTCEAMSPFRDISSISGANYPYVYDHFYENKENAFLSFLEQIGSDDTHQFYRKDINNITALHQTVESSGEEGYRLDDATGYMAADPQRGIIPFFYQMQDWELDLNQNNVPRLPEQCYWWDVRSGIVCDPATQPPTIAAQLALPVDPANPELVNNNTYVVDGVVNNKGGVFPPLAADKIVIPDGIIAADDVCVLDPEDGFWKRGSDLFCSTTYPYMNKCDKHHPGTCTLNGQPIDCQCGDVPGEENKFPNDALDDWQEHIPLFLKFAENYIDTDVRDLARTFQLSYSNLAQWIEPASPPAVKDVDCFACNKTPGKLVSWRDQIIQVRGRLQNWREEESFTGESCDEVWCVPPDGCPLVQPDEAATFGTGNFDGVIQCLEHNLNNDTRFEACYAACEQAAIVPGAPGWLAGDPPFPGNSANFVASNDACGTNPLPRSLLPAFDATGEFVLADIARLQFLEGCPDFCTNCLNDCESQYTTDEAVCTSTYNTDVTACNQAQTACSTDCNAMDPCVIPGCDPAACATPGCCDTTCPRYADIPACLSGCTTEETTCLDNADATRVSCMAPVEASRLNCLGSNCECVDSNTTDAYTPDTFLCTDPSNVNQPNPSLQIELNAAYEAPSAICSFVENVDPGTGNILPDSYLEHIRLSALEAKNQVAKFSRRAQSLHYTINELDRIIGILQEAEDKLTEFLDGPAQDLIDERIAFDEEELGISFQVIYAWQSEPPKHRVEKGIEDGYWHIARVDARLPSRCYDRCGVGGGSDPLWPWVESYTKDDINVSAAIGIYIPNTIICYRLVSTDGIVKMRVTRFDEDRDKSEIRLPTGQKLWDYRYFHPDRESEDLTGLASGGAGSSCNNLVLKGPPGHEDIYQGAFMMNKRIDEGDLANSDCWDRVNEILDSGVMSEICAQYFVRENDESMGFQFIKCPNF